MKNRFRKFGCFEFHFFKVEHGWSYNWIFRINEKLAFHIALFKKEAKP